MLPFKLVYRDEAKKKEIPHLNVIGLPKRRTAPAGNLPIQCVYVTQEHCGLYNVCM